MPAGSAGGLFQRCPLTNPWLVGDSRRHWGRGAGNCAGMVRRCMVRALKARLATGLALALAAALASTVQAAASQLIRISSDPYTNATSQHRTQVEPDTFSFGNTV